MKSYERFMEEKTLNRVWSYFESTKPIAILSAFRKDYESRENVSRNKRLASTIKNAGYGYVWMIGHWVEVEGDAETDTKEDSILAIGGQGDGGRMKKLVLDMMKKYDQNAIIFKPEGPKQDVLLIDEYGKVTKLGKFTPNKVAQAYSTLRGRGGGEFVFESAKVEKNWIGKLADSLK